MHDLAYWQDILECFKGAEDRATVLDEACAQARNVRDVFYGRDVFIRGLIEISNYCKNDCFYCGIRCGNKQAQRYRLAPEEILERCRIGYELGFRTFVLQGGEDPWFTDDRLCPLIEAMRMTYPDCAITLSLGERSRESYRRLFEAGANRYLLRHETADTSHYARLHPADMTLENRLQCLYDLKEIGFQTGCGFMVGSPGQTIETLAQDLALIEALQPNMVGIGPFIPHAQTPFAHEPAGSIELTLYLLATVRLMLPTVLLPATTALATLHPEGRELGLNAGANVLMPNLTPAAYSENYRLYDGKVYRNEEAAENLQLLKERLSKAGYTIIVDRGDSKKR